MQTSIKPKPTYTKLKYILAYIITAFILFFNLLMLLYPKETLIFAKDGLILWYNSVLPILLPFIMLTDMLVALKLPQLLGRILFKPMNRIFNVGGEAAFVIIMGLLSGYPIGAKLTCDLCVSGTIDRRQAQRLLLFTNNCSPLFIIGTLCTGLLNNKSCCVIILTSHYLSALLIGVFLGRLSPKINAHKPFVGIASLKDIPNAAADASAAIIGVGCYIMLFSVIIGLLQTTGLLSRIAQPLMLLELDESAAQAIVGGAMEMTNGCKLASRSAISIPLCTAIISFGGLSVHFQGLPYIVAAKLSFMSYLIFKLLQAVLAFAICCVLIIFLK